MSPKRWGGPEPRAPGRPTGAFRPARQRRAEFRSSFEILEDRTLHAVIATLKGSKGPNLDIDLSRPGRGPRGDHLARLSLSFRTIDHGTTESHPCLASG